MGDGEVVEVETEAVPHQPVSSGMLPCASWPPPAPPQLLTSITLGNPNSAPPAVYSNKALEQEEDEEESNRRESKKKRRSRSRSREDRRSRRKRSRSKHKKHRKPRRRRSSSESSWSSEDDVRRIKRKKRSQSPEVIAIRSPEVISLSPGETSPVSRDSPYRAPPLADQPAIAPTVSKMTEDLRAKVRAMLNN